MVPSPFSFRGVCRDTFEPQAKRMPGGTPSFVERVALRTPEPRCRPLLDRREGAALHRWSSPDLHAARSAEADNVELEQLRDQLLYVMQAVEALEAERDAAHQDAEDLGLHIGRLEAELEAEKESLQRAASSERRRVEGLRAELGEALKVAAGYSREVAHLEGELQRRARLADAGGASSPAAAVAAMAAAICAPPMAGGRGPCADPPVATESPVDTDRRSVAPSIDRCDTVAVATRGTSGSGASTPRPCRAPAVPAPAPVATTKSLAAAPPPSADRSRYLGSCSGGRSRSAHAVFAAKTDAFRPMQKDLANALRHALGMNMAPAAA